MQTGGRLRILIVDDSVVYRKAVRDVLAELPDVEVIGSAADGARAVEMVSQLSPDLLTLDLEMPKLDGLAVLRRIHAEFPATSAIMLSGHTSGGIAATSKALQLGAFDFVVKPTGDSAAESLQLLRDSLLPRVKAFISSRGQNDNVPRAAIPRPLDPATEPIQVVAIGISTGGPAALAQLLPDLPSTLPVPVLVVQHMPPMFTESLANDLNNSCSLTVSEAVDGHRPQAGEILIAPGGRQMKLVPDLLGAKLRITDDAPERGCRPSVDYLFRSLAETYGPRSLGVMMTGMGDDGAAGCRLLRARGARLIAQDEETCVVFGMPKQPVTEGLVDDVVPLQNIASKIHHLTTQRYQVCG